MKSYTVTYAMPGYLPEADPVSFPSYRKARAYVMETAFASGTVVKPRGITAKGKVISWTEIEPAADGQPKHPTGYMWEVYPANIANPGDRSELARYRRYETRCGWESCDPLTFAMWKVHGRPPGPV